jgi:hypothetical protein
MSLMLSYLALAYLLSSSSTRVVVAVIGHLRHL